MTDDFSQTIQGVKNTIDDFTDRAAGAITVEAKNTLDKLGDLAGESGQKFNDLTTNLTQSVRGLNEATTTLKASVLEATGGAVNTITEATNQAASAVKETSDKATGTLNDATNVAVHKLNDATSSITQTAEKTKLALDETLQKAEQLSGAIATSVQNVVVTSVKMWMSEHPIISWMLAHPLGTLALALLILFLCWGLLGAIAQFTQQAWLFILRAPLKLAQLLSGSIFQLFKRSDALQLIKLENQQDVQRRIPEILDRLGALRQEQESLMREMELILTSKSF